MDPKRKRLYIIIISVCLVGAVGVLLWGQLGGPSTGVAPSPVGLSDPSLMINNTASSDSTFVVITPPESYTPPSVFPQNKAIDASILKSAVFSSLQDFQAIKLNPNELGRDNPFKPY